MLVTLILYHIFEIESLSLIVAKIVKTVIKLSNLRLFGHIITSGGTGRLSADITVLAAVTPHLVRAMLGLFSILRRINYGEISLFLRHQI